MLENENNQIENEEVNSDGEADLMAAIAALKNSEDQEDTDTNDETVTDEETNEEETNEDSDDSETDEQDEDEQDEEEEVTPEDKKKQSKEENAKFAAKRRQEELDRKVAEKLEEVKQQDPNYLLAKQISELYGDTPENILAQMKEAQLVKRAEAEGVSVESLRKEQETNDKVSALQSELNLLRYQSWKNQLATEAQTLKQKYTMLSDDDMQEAQDYILDTAKDINFPLSQAVMALHGEKIIEATVNAKAQDQLADQSGRSKKTPPPPSNGKASNKSTELSDQEKFIAKQLGISFDDYLKNK